MRVADLIESLRELDPDLDVRAKVFHYRFLTDEEIGSRRLPNGKWKPDTLCDAETRRPVEMVTLVSTP